jgi:hypothetical protein
MREAPRDGIRHLASRYGPPLSIQATRLATPAPDANAAGLRPPRPEEFSTGASGSPHAYPGSASVWSLVEAAASVTAAGPSAVEGEAHGEDAVASGAFPLGILHGGAGDDSERHAHRDSGGDAGPRDVDGWPADREFLRHALAPSPRATFAGGDRRNAELSPVTADQWSLRVTMDTGMKDDLETLKSLLSHTANGDLTAILREALRCAIEKHGKRRGAIAPTRTRSTASAPSDRGPSDGGRSDDRPGETRPSGAMPSCVSRGARSSDAGRSDDRPGGTRPDAIDSAGQEPGQEPLNDPPAPDVQAIPGGAGRRDARFRATGSPNTIESPNAPGSPDASLRSAGRASTAPPNGAAKGTAPPSTALTGTASPSTTPPGDPPPSTTRTSSAPPGGVPRAPSTARTIPAAVRREVWARDNGCCSWRSRDGRRCGSRWKLELDHIQPVALGGDSTVANLRLICRAHNVRHAEQIFGRRHMARFTR